MEGGSTTLREKAVLIPWLSRAWRSAQVAATSLAGRLVYSNHIDQSDLKDEELQWRMYLCAYI